MRQPHYRVEMVDYIERDAVLSYGPPRDPRVLNHPEFEQDDITAAA